MNLFYSDYYENTCVYTIKQDRCGFLSTDSFMYLFMVEHTIEEKKFDAL
jgi:hypothetical protein